jgi:predicted ester cyclase
MYASAVRGTAPMRRTTPIWLLAIALAAATGAVLSGLVAVVTAPLPVLPGVDRGSAAVWAFYDAANHLLHTGETAPLDALLADDMVEHDPAPGLPPSGSGLIRRLLGLHVTHPGMTLVVEEVLASGDLATARVHVEGSEQGVFLGLTVGEDRAAWGPLDQFWVVDGRIVEHWGVPDRFALLAQTGILNRLS